MFISTYITAVFGIICLALSSVIIYEKRRNRLALYLALVTFSVAIWVLSNSIADVTISSRMVIFLSGMAVIGFQFFASFFLHFLIYFVHGKEKGAYRELAFAYIPTIIISFFAFSSYAVKEVYVLYTAPAQVAVGPLYKIGPIFMITVFIIAYYKLFKNYASFSRSKQLQTLYVILGTSCTLLGVIVFDILLPIWGEYRFFSTGPLSTALLIGFILYAIFRHHLLDIRIALQKSTTYAILLFLITTTYISILLILNTLVGDLVRATSIISAGLTTILGIFTFPFLEKYFSKITANFFFKDKYDYSDAIDALSEVVNKNLDLRKLIEQVSKTLKSIFRTNYVAFIKKEDITSQDQSDIYIPIVIEGKLIGLLCLGVKLSGDSYNQDDLKLLKTFAYQAGIAIQRAELYETVKKHTRELETKVRERTEEIQRLQEEQKQMVFDISHGLQTPLTVIKNGLEFLKRRMPKDNELGTFERSINKISKFIYDLLSLARLENQDIKFQPFNLSDMINEQIEYFNILAKEKGIIISSTVEPEIIILGKKDDLQDLLINLVSNALKYVSKNKSRKTIDIRLAKVSNKIKLSVEDNGIGIQEKDLALIFDRFYRIRHDTTSQTRGTGLGLSICKKIVNKHGGIITVESEYGRGAKFIAIFPHQNA